MDAATGSDSPAPRPDPTDTGSPRRTPLSLNLRLLLAASLVLVAFLGLTGLALDRAFAESALAAVRDRLQGNVYLLLGVAELDPRGELDLPDVLPEARLSSPGSGLYAEIDGESGVVWRSDSTLGRKIAYPPAGSSGQAQFAQVEDESGRALFALSFAVEWEVDPGRVHRFTIRSAEASDAYESQVTGFRRSLFGWLIAAAVVLLAAQGAILRWSLAPLRRVARELTDIEAGQREELTGTYPEELRGLTDNLNGLIRHTRSLVRRYRNGLGDLAHSLKTPLAVLRSVTEGGDRADLESLVQEQVERMDRTVQYQLQRAAAQGRTTLAAPVDVTAQLRRIRDSLAKVYAHRGLEISISADDGLRFRGDEGDLMEIMGNLADNACKWAGQRVVLRARRAPGQGGAGVVLVMEVEDDGPGIPPDRVELILQRGGRADPSTEGQGIGLAVVRDLVENAYEGRLTIGDSASGGTLVRVELDA